MADVEKARQRRSWPFVVLTYSRVRSTRQAYSAEVATKAERACGLADLAPPKRLRAGERAFLNILLSTLGIQ